MTLVQRKYYLLQRNWVFETLISFLSYRFDNEHYKDPLRSNKPSARPLKALNARPFETSIINGIRYTKKDL